MSGLKKYIWCAFIPSLILWGVLQFALRGFVININANYILSSITQGLASLVALLFVIVFFLCQSTGRVSMLSQVLKPDGYFLLGIFIISIIYPLIVMKIDPTDILVNISISGTVFCLASLFPFIISINDKMKEFGISTAVSEITPNKEYRRKLKTEEIIDDLLMFDPKDIVKSTPDKIVSLLMTLLEGKVNDDFYAFSKRKRYIEMMTQIGSLSFILNDKKEHLYKVQEFIFNSLNRNYYPIPTMREKSKELFSISLFGISIILSNLKKYKKCSEDIRSLFAESLTQTLLRIFSLLKNGKEGDKDVIKNKKILEGKVLTFLKERKIYKKDYEKVVEDIISPANLEELNIAQELGCKFKDHFRVLLNSNE